MVKRSQVHDTARGDGGFSMVEALVGIFILTTVALGLGQVVGMGMASNASSDEVTQSTSLAATKLEELRSADYDSLIEGGDLDADVEGYAEELDVDADGRTDFTRRWQITDQVGGKLVEVRTVSAPRGDGAGKVALMATVVADPDDDLAVP